MTYIQNKLSSFTKIVLQHWYALLIGFVILGFAGYYGQRIGADFDETFNLQIPAQLVSGMGYSTYAGKLFDPVITTGFPVLLPIAFLFKINGIGLLTARIVSIGYLALFLLLAYTLLYRWYGRLAAFIGLIFPILLDDFLAYTIKIYGELPGAVFLLACVLLLDEKLFFLAGLFLGLSVQTKFVYIFSLAAVGIYFGVELLQHRHDRAALKSTLSRSVVFAAGFLVPFVLWEIVRLVELGPLGYQTNINEMLAVFNNQNVGTDVTQATIIARMNTISDVFMQQSFVGVALAALTILNPIFQVYKRRKISPQLATIQLFLPVFCTIYFYWWLFMRNFGWLRHIYPALLILSLLASVLIAQWINAAILLIRTHGNPPQSGRIAQNVFHGLGILLILISASTSIVYTRLNHVRAELKITNLPSQKEFSAIVKEMDSQGNLFVYFDWFQSPEVSFLSGVKFYNLNNPGDLNIVQSARERGIKAYCITTPAEELLASATIQQRIDQKICSTPIIQNNGYTMSEYTQ